MKQETYGTRTLARFLTKKNTCSNIVKLLFSNSRLPFSQNFYNSFITSAVNEFQKMKECGDESCIILPSLFEITKPFNSIEIPYCELDEIKSKYFFKKFLELSKKLFQNCNNMEN